ncbi:ABC transporter ATP-binding protein [Bacillaceae bacterium]
MPILEVRDLSVSFTQYRKGFRQQTDRVVENLHLAVESGEVVAVVGASGSGKSLLAHAILGILPSNARVTGTIRYQGEELTPQRQAEIRGREIAFVPQSVRFLDPLMRVGTQVRLAVRKGDPIAAQRAAFQRYRLGEDAEKLYPFQLSGGMARRVLVSIATVSGAKLIIADEPTPGLDPAVIREALSYFRELADRGRAVMIISHDLAAVLTIADKIAVFFGGTIVEIVHANAFVGQGERLRHPYTRALWRALPQNDFAPASFSSRSQGASSGCPFVQGCEWATDECDVTKPDARWLDGGMVRCIYGA